MRASNGRFIPGILNPRDLLIRHLIILAMSVFFGTLSTLSKGAEWFSAEWAVSTSFNFIYIASIWNGDMLLIRLLLHRLSWENQARKLIIGLALISIIWPVVTHYLFNLIIFPVLHGHPCSLHSKENINSLIISVTITLLVNTIFAAITFFYSWRRSMNEKEVLKREGLTAEFETLKSQINPHFLFNSLNTLTSLIEENKATATEFVQQLAGVYRYVLTQKDKDLVTLREELNFVNAYIYLNQIRFGENLKIEIQVDPKLLEKKLVTLSLQMLIENAIKHNIISTQRPLTIRIETNENQVVVSNNLQRKTVMHESNGIGLNNIAHRYSLLSKLEVDISDDGFQFTVALPLI
ncbi:MAG: histidine kinase [Bacteroidia bacterium]|jgi:sensor histidine kinase YesM